MLLQFAGPIPARQHGFLFTAKLSQFASGTSDFCEDLGSYCEDAEQFCVRLVEVTEGCVSTDAKIPKKRSIDEVDIDGVKMPVNKKARLSLEQQRVQRSHANEEEIANAKIGM